MNDVMELVEELEKAQAELKKARAELELARKIFWLARNHDFFLAGEGPLGEVNINCGDLFVAAADSQHVEESELDELIEICRRWPWAGCHAWVAAKRGGSPLRDSVRNPEWQRQYDEALLEIPALLEARKSQSHA